MACGWKLMLPLALLNRSDNRGARPRESLAALTEKRSMLSILRRDLGRFLHMRFIVG